MVKTPNKKAINSPAIAALGAVIAVTSYLPQTTYAQATIEEIIVTARKREENLQETPLSISAYTETALEERGITALQDIADATPGFDFSQAFGRQDFRPSIRGQSNILGRANAGLFIDGIIVERGAASIPLSALERVEVVKGPQSALYGRSTLSGAINYVLKKPAEEFEGDIYVEVAERDQLKAEVHLSGPISDTLGYAVTFSHYERGGEYDNTLAANGLGTPAISDDVGGEETDSFTAVLAFNPNDRLSITSHLMYESSDDDQYPIALQSSSANNCFRVGVDTDASGNVLTQPAPPPGTPEASASTVTSPGYNASGYYCGRVDVDDVLRDNGGDTSLETTFYDDPGTETESLRLGFRFDYDLTEAFTLTSVTGYNSVDRESRGDQTFGGGDTRFPVVGVGSPFFVQGFGALPTIESRVGFILDESDEFEDFSQEIRLAYDAEALHYMIGFYYYQSEDDGTQITSFDTTTSTSAQGIPAFSPFNPGFVPATISTSAFYEGAPAVDQGTNEIDSWSVFGSVEYDFTEKLTLGLEVRYNEDEFEFSRAADNVNVDGSFDAFLPKFTAKYQMTPEFLIYGNIAKGNKPGSLNSQEGLPAADQAVDEETALNFEVGIKSTWLDNRLRANLALYHIDWEDMQLTSTRAATVNGQARTFSILENVGEASIDGLELELTLDVTDFWSIFLGYAYTDSEIDKFVQSVDAGASAGSAFREAALLFGYSASGDVIISGTQLPQSSKHQLNLSNTFTGSMSEDWSWFLRADMNYNSKRYAQVYNLAHTGDREVVNFRAGVRSDAVDVELWVDNAFDNDDPTQLIRYVQANDLTFNPFNRAIGVTLPEERRVGVNVRYRF